MIQTGLQKKIEYVCKKIPNTNRLVRKIDCSTNVTGIENRPLSVTGLVTTAALNTKTTEIENKTSDITSLANKAV